MTNKNNKNDGKDLFNKFMDSGLFDDDTDSNYKEVNLNIAIKGTDIQITMGEGAPYCYLDVMESCDNADIQAKVTRALEDVLYNDGRLANNYCAGYG